MVETILTCICLKWLEKNEQLELYNVIMIIAIITLATTPIMFDNDDNH